MGFYHTGGNGIIFIFKSDGFCTQLLPNGDRRKVIEDPQSLHVALDRTRTLNGESGDWVSKAVSGWLNVKFVSPLWTPVSLSVK